jgi:hypothetical protein
MNRWNRRIVFTAGTILPVIVLACMISLRTTAAQVACGQTGDHVVHVGKTTGSTHLSDCDSPRISRQNRHNVTWQALGNDTLTIEFNKNGNPFLNFSCVNQKRCTSGAIDPEAKTGMVYNYKITLSSGGNTLTEDPGVIIDP